MKALRYAIGTAFVVVIGLILTAWLQQPINDFFRNDRIIASMTIGPWEARPDFATKKPIESTDAASAYLEALDDLSNSMKSKEAFAHLTLKNNSEKVITNIRVKLGSQADVFLASENPKPEDLKEDIKIIDVPDMKPGDDLTYHLWTGFTVDPEYFAKDVSTFSSSGPFRIEFSWPEQLETFDVTGFDRFVENWLPYILFGLLLLLVIVLGLFSAAYEEALKKILKDENLYRSEREKFEKNPKAYNPFEGSKQDGEPPKTS